MEVEFFRNGEQGAGLFQHFRGRAGSVLAHAIRVSYWTLCYLPVIGENFNDIIHLYFLKTDLKAFSESHSPVIILALGHKLSSPFHR